MSQEVENLKGTQILDDKNEINKLTGKDSMSLTEFIGPQLPKIQLDTSNFESEREDEAVSELKDVWKSDLTSKGLTYSLRSLSKRNLTTSDRTPETTQDLEYEEVIATVEEKNDTLLSGELLITETEGTEDIEKSTQLELAQLKPVFESEPVTSPMEVEETVNEELLTSRLHFDENTELIEIARWRSTKKEQYTRGSIWSPDGTCLLTAINQLGILVFDTPTDIYQVESIDPARPVSKLVPAFQISDSKESNIYDMAWYPGMTSLDPATCCFLVTRQHEPIHCYDAFDGTLRCTYRGYNDVDECEPALSVCFSTDGDHIFAGFKKSIKTFLTARPGRDFETIKTKSAVSAISATENIIAAGGWNTSISIFDQRNQVTEAPVYIITGQHKGGITHLKLLGDNWLISGGRKDNKLILWDLRNVLAKPYCIYNREVATNQRIYFDMSLEGKWLISGNTNGQLRAWNLFETFADPEAPVNEYSYPLYEDCCNGVSAHPSLPVVASCSGQFRFENDDIRNNFVNMWWVNNIHEHESLTLDEFQVES